MAAVATVTYQNSLGMSGKFDIPDETLVRQLEKIFDDREPEAVKTGALGSPANVQAVYGILRGRHSGFLVVDPVFESTGGGILLDSEGVGLLAETLLPLATLATPNRYEASVLAGIEINDQETLQSAAEKIAGTNGAVLITGFRTESDRSVDLLWDGDGARRFERPYREGLEVHGTGCVLSSAIAALLARGLCLQEAVEEGLRLVGVAIEGAARPGCGSPCADPSAWERKEGVK